MSERGFVWLDTIRSKKDSATILARTICNRQVLYHIGVIDMVTARSDRQMEGAGYQMAKSRNCVC